VHKRRSNPQGPNGLENGGNACAVICGTGSGFDTVVMSYKKNRWSATLPSGHSREYVLHSSGAGIACANASGILDLRLKAQGPELPDDIVAHPIMLCAPNRMWPLSNGKHMLHCALCRKRTLWSICWKSGGWTTCAFHKHDASCDKQEGNNQPLNRATFHREVLTRRYTTLPPAMVVSTFTLRMASSLRSKLLSLRTTMSVSLPGATEVVGNRRC
jgi:hypothetical protein